MLLMTTLLVHMLTTPPPPTSASHGAKHAHRTPQQQFHALEQSMLKRDVWAKHAPEIQQKTMHIFSSCYQASVYIAAFPCCALFPEGTWNPPGRRARCPAAVLQPTSCMHVVPGCIAGPEGIKEGRHPTKPKHAYANVRPLESIQHLPLKFFKL